MIVCVPGPWVDRRDFLEAVATKTRGEFLFAGGLLAHPKGGDHVEVELAEPYGQMAEAFGQAGRGTLSGETLDEIARHKGVAYLRFPLDVASERLRLLKFTEAVSRCGGVAVLIENSGVAHEWASWFEMLESGEPSDAYRACVALVGDGRHYYSCGMHCFGLPDAQIPGDVNAEEAAELLNAFNLYRLVEQPSLAPGHTFSRTAGGPLFRLELVADGRHGPDDLFHNAHGLWDLARA